MQWWFAQRILDTSTQTNLRWRGARLADRAADDGSDGCVDCRVSCRGVLEEMPMLMSGSGSRSRDAEIRLRWGEVCGQLAGEQPHPNTPGCCAVGAGWRWLAVSIC